MYLVVACNFTRKDVDLTKSERGSLMSKFFESKEEAIDYIENSSNSYHNPNMRLFEISKEHVFNLVEVEERHEVISIVNKLEFI
jgi:hypothetical protein|tara:strand:- start:44 stop:295 length:252 start_codon:yes stop_codon:yes gene_type:complete